MVAEFCYSDRISIPKQWIVYKGGQCVEGGFYWNVKRENLILWHP